MGNGQTRGEGRIARPSLRRRDGGSSSSTAVAAARWVRPIPSPVRPSRPPSPPLSIYLSVPVTDRKPGRVARTLTSVALRAAVSPLDGRPAPLGRRGGTTRRRPRRPRRRRTPCWPRTPPSCLSRPSVRPSPLSLSMLCSSPCSLLFPSPLPFLPLLSSPRSVGPSFLRLFSLVQHCNAAPPSSCSPCYCAEYVLLGFPPDKISRFYNQKTTFFEKFELVLQKFSLKNLRSLSLPVVQTGRTDKRVAEPAGQPRELLNDAAKLARLKWSHGINPF